MLVISDVISVVAVVVPEYLLHNTRRDRLDVGADDHRGLFGFGGAIAADVRRPADLGDPDLFRRAVFPHEGVRPSKLTDIVGLLRGRGISVRVDGQDVHLVKAAEFEDFLDKVEIRAGSAAADDFRLGVGLLHRVVGGLQEIGVLLDRPTPEEYVGLVPDLPVLDAILVTADHRADVVAVVSDALLSVRLRPACPVAEQSEDADAVLSRRVHSCIERLPVPLAPFPLQVLPVELVTHPFDADVLCHSRGLFHRCRRVALPEVDAHAEWRVGNQFLGAGITAGVNDTGENSLSDFNGFERQMDGPAIRLQRLRRLPLETVHVNVGGQPELAKPDIASPDADTALLELILCQQQFLAAGIDFPAEEISDAPRELRPHGTRKYALALKG